MLPRSFQEGSQVAPRRLPGDSQRLPGGTQGPGGSQKEDLQKPLGFSVERGATDRFACTGASRPSRSLQPAIKNERAPAAGRPRTNLMSPRLCIMLRLWLGPLVHILDIPRDIEK